MTGWPIDSTRTAKVSPRITLIDADEEARATNLTQLKTRRFYFVTPILADSRLSA